MILIYIKIGYFLRRPLIEGKDTKRILMIFIFVQNFIWEEIFLL